MISTKREDHRRLAGDLGRPADRMEDESERLRKEIADVREDWEHKRADESVPGAPPPDEAEGHDDAEAAGTADGEDGTPEDRDDPAPGNRERGR